MTKNNKENIELLGKWWILVITKKTNYKLLFFVLVVVSFPQK
jgi:hypothetical protein